MSLDNVIDVLPKTGRFMTVAEYFDLPEGPPYSQLIEGELIMSPAPSYFHQRIIIKLIISLEAFVEAHRLGVMMIAPADVELSDQNVFQPDVFFVSKERLHLIDGQRLKGAPEFVVEIISGTGRRELGLKKKAYARAGVGEFWIVLPKTREVEIWRFAESTTQPAFRFGLGDVLTTQILPGWSLPVADMIDSRFAA